MSKLTRYQQMWIRVTASRFKRQESIRNASTYFEFEYLDTRYPEIIRMNHDAGFQMFLEELKMN